ncbi:collagen alpha-1(XIII) chain isoform X2 [Oreochromis niloticus]|uniref:collagen alpha-1(XIII) chain isoform X2 n=1 Tax=Oreochromis niloticus TaxID=8128 RepID=UPI00090474CC|nr:collagen alpha-1(XIII) chain isoform X2 [Oreochromis niloticus]
MSEMEQEKKWGVAGKPGEKRRIGLKQPLWRDLCCVAFCIAVSVLSVGVWIVVFVRTSELQSRIVSLEQQRLSAWMLSVEQVEPVILGRLDQILEEKLAARLPKTRDAREVSHSCLCPPGPPVSTPDAVCDLHMMK